MEGLLGEQINILYKDDDSIIIVLPGPCEANGRPPQPLFLLEKTNDVCSVSFTGKKNYNTIYFTE